MNPLSHQGSKPRDFKRLNNQKSRLRVYEIFPLADIAGIGAGAAMAALAADSTRPRQRGLNQCQLRGPLSRRVFVQVDSGVPLRPRFFIHPVPHPVRLRAGNPALFLILLDIYHYLCVIHMVLHKVHLHVFCILRRALNKITLCMSL